MKKIIIILIALISFSHLHAQQDAMYTHYMYNMMDVNPGYAGSRDALSVTLLHRTQWATLDGAPETQTLTVHSPIFNDEMGVGLSVRNDALGPSKKLSVYADLSYRFLLVNKSYLAFGLKGGVNNYKTSFEGFDIGDVYDNTFQEGETSKLTPNFGFGVYYYATKYYVGLSTPKILENKLYNDNITESRHYYLIGGVIMAVNKDLKFKPTTLIKVTPAAPLQADVTAAFLYKNMFEIGVKYRSGDAFGFLVGVDITKKLKFGYSFDTSYDKYWDSAEKNIQRTSHELLLRYEFKYKSKFISPRFF